MENGILIQNAEQLKDKIYLIRGIQVVLDIDLAFSFANKTIYIVDNYIFLKTLVLLINANQNVAVTVFSDNLNNGLHKVEFNDFCREYPGLKIDGLNKDCFAIFE